MGLPAKQLRVIQGVEVQDSGDQTLQQARKLAAADSACLWQLEGVTPPAPADILAALTDA